MVGRYMMLVIYGPTTTGKTDLALQLASKLGGELISADSRQVYRGLDIGTGKVSFKARVERHKGFWIVDGVKIHGFDLVGPGQNFTVADYLKFANTTMIRIIEVNKLPIIVGGTGFYIKALIDGIESLGIPQDQKLRKKLEKLSVGALYQKLLRLDNKRALKMNKSDRLNPRRLIRAIEIARASTSEEFLRLRSGSISEANNYKLQTINYKLVCLTAPNDYLYQRSNRWLDVRLDNGLVDEVKNLLEKKVDPVWLDNLGLEYRWITRFVQGKIPLGFAKERLKGDIHSFIRRQKTWFKQFKELELFDITRPNLSKEIGKKLGTRLR